MSSVRIERVGKTKVCPATASVVAFHISEPCHRSAQILISHLAMCNYRNTEAHFFFQKPTLIAHRCFHTGYLPASVAGSGINYQQPSSGLPVSFIGIEQR